MFVQPRFANAIAVNKPAGPPPAMSVSPGPSFVRQLLLLLGGAAPECSGGRVRVVSGGRKALVQQTNATGSRARMVSCTCVPAAIRCCKRPRRDVEARAKKKGARLACIGILASPGLYALLVPYAPSCAVQSIQQHTCLRLPAVQTAVLQAQVAAAPALALQHSAEQRLRCAHDRIRSYRSLCKRSSTAIDV